MGKNDIFRFAFGTCEKPGSSVWRINTSRNGDVFLNNMPTEANETHISLHASGRFHVKQFADKYVDITGPAKIESGLFIGLVIEFRKWDICEIPIMKATGKTSLVNWLGWPKANHFLRVVLFYCNLDEDIALNVNMERIKTFSGVKLFNSPMNLHIVKEKVHISNNEINSTTNYTYDEPQNTGGKPDNMEVIRFSSNSLFTIVSHSSVELKDGKIISRG